MQSNQRGFQDERQEANNQGCRMICHFTQVGLGLVVDLDTKYGTLNDNEP